MMNSKQLIGLVAALVISVPAFAAADQYLYKSSSDLTAQGVLAIQQHTVFVEIIQERVNEAVQVQIHQFAAVVALVKRCIQNNNRRVFDNAVLWFNDQFLFGQKRNEEARENITQNRLGVLQAGFMIFETRDIDAGDNSTDSKAFNRHGYGRWVGCFVPRGFLHAIGTDDPLGTGLVQTPVTGIAAVRQLIDLDNNVNCDGCIFAYSGSFYVTDPNGYEWLIDKYVYPGVASVVLGACGDVSNIHVSTGGSLFDTGCSAEQHRDTAADDEAEPDDENHCFEDASTPAICDADQSDPTDTPREENVKLTTLEPLYSVHLQVDPADMEGIMDTALWAWSTGATRPGAARYESATDPTVCPVGANNADIDASPDGSPSSPPDPCPGPLITTGVDDGCAVGTLVAQCAIEYSAVIVVDFEAFDDILPIVPTDNFENEISRMRKSHGTGGLDSADESKEGNSHPHNPTNLVAGDNGPLHTHDAVALDLFFVDHVPATCDPALADPTGDIDGCGAPRFSMANFVWSGVTGAPPDAAAGDCTSVSAARTFIVCDTDDDAGDFHLHDGSQTV